MSPLTIAILLVIYVIILWVFVSFALRKGYKEWRSNHDNREYKVSARIMDKREVKNTSSDVSSWDQFLTLEYSGRQKEMKVIPEIYSSVRVGQTGILKLNKQQVVSFEPDAGTEKTDDIYRRIVKG
ncbi:MAG: DUF2500 family protein [Armatimonadota bacterium]